MITVLANKSRNFGAIRKFIIENDSRQVKTFDMVFSKVDWSELESAISLDIYTTRTLGDLSCEIDDYVWRLGVYDDFYHDTVIISTSMPFNKESLKNLRAVANRIHNKKPKMKVLIGMMSEEDFGLMSFEEAQKEMS